ncbi:hypothetical protein [Thiorhodovibrio frisius]|uniref:hypothetical protein n=1 Tax=Thiorhodovibrio frisius TaxID=631362 RepID=UPI000255DDE0|nr:hypothetical protein [Thiorhodovibrio frisius]
MMMSGTLVRAVGIAKHEDGNEYQRKNSTDSYDLTSPERGKDAAGLLVMLICIHGLAHSYLLLFRFTVMHISAQWQEIDVVKIGYRG